MLSSRRCWAVGLRLRVKALKCPSQLLLRTTIETLQTSQITKVHTIQVLRTNQINQARSGTEGKARAWNSIDTSDFGTLHYEWPIFRLPPRTAARSVLLPHPLPAWRSTGFLPCLVTAPPPTPPYIKKQPDISRCVLWIIPNRIRKTNRVLCSQRTPPFYQGHPWNFR